jgi:hypothetical protein
MTQFTKLMLVYADNVNRHGVCYRALSSRIITLRRERRLEVSARSEEETKTQLYEPSAIDCAGDLSKGGIPSRPIRIGKVRPIEQIVELASKLYVSPLGYAEIL